MTLERETSTKHFKLTNIGRILNGGVNLIRKRGSGVVIENFCAFSVKRITQSQVTLTVIGINGLDLNQFTTPPRDTRSIA